MPQQELQFPITRQGDFSTKKITLLIGSYRVLSEEELELDRHHRSDSSLSWGKDRSIEDDQAGKSVKIVDLLNWIGSPIRFPPNLSFVFVVYFIRAHLRGASLGTRLSGDVDRS